VPATVIDATVTDATTDGVGAGGGVVAARSMELGGRSGGPASTGGSGGPSSADATSAKAGSAAAAASIAPISARTRIARHVTSAGDDDEEEPRPVLRY
jgi:hypothetical protein